MKLAVLCSLVSLCMMIGCSKEDSITMSPTMATTIYVSNLGNDANDGKTPETAWRTIAKINSQDLVPGQSILFRAGDSFNGSLDLSREAGSETSPITIGTYGSGRAIIDAGPKGSGIIARNSSNIKIRDLIIKADGYKINPSNGIFFYTDSSAIMKNIQVINVEVSGFMGRGLFFNVPWPGETTNPGGQLPTPGNPKAGYDGILIENVEAHDNGVAGIETSGYWNLPSWVNNYNHKNVTVRNSKAYNNRGVLNYTDHISGSGIFVGSADVALVEYCEAYNNGEENGMAFAGAIGIWFGEVKNGIIQHCESYNNKGGQDVDGGGFDIDGGSQHCVIQYCYSHHNEGGGFCVYEWGSGNPMSDITVRYNISENDGYKNNYGGITLWSVQNIDNIKIHNNTVYIGSMNVASTSAMNTIRIFDDQQFSNLKFFNNILIAVGSDARILNGEIRSGDWKNNIYWTADGSTIDGFVYGKYQDPKLVSPGTIATMDPNTRINSSLHVLGYSPANGSPAINAGITLGIPMAPIDYKGMSLPSGGGYDIGAIEF